jgi:hypothetical protein
MPMWVVREDDTAVNRMAAAQVVHSTNKNGTKRAGEGGALRVSALFHSYVVDFHAFCCVAIF